MEILNKITMKTIGAVPEPKSLKKGEAAPVATVYGLANGYKVGQSTYGEFVRFTGSFEAVCATDGKVYKSGNLILPRVIEGILQSAIEGAGEDAKAGIGFSIIVGVKFSEKGQTGYEWTVEPVEEPKENDALADLRAKTAQAVKALPAPKKDHEEKGKK